MLSYSCILKHPPRREESKTLKNMANGLILMPAHNTIIRDTIPNKPRCSRRFAGGRRHNGARPDGRPVGAAPRVRARRHLSLGHAHHRQDTTLSRWLFDRRYKMATSPLPYHPGSPGLNPAMDGFLGDLPTQRCATLPFESEGVLDQLRAINDTFHGRSEMAVHDEAGNAEPTLPQWLLYDQVPDYVRT
ncbi:hypothetical protein SODALDRAFT_374886 [Sodiomyces alkalinus F11]|uniref:Uncharacterized protein n=1 Tax=Sodiomyces alkalinus (strain CBS 110278 / VKM F-3762 / F11) TaxID=1314773 RepID=A0A3N2Q7D5_SODAK|nr:hypothetical protein SODALDRAFT_374886 [Sodiomyces alkalinus F11]ROT42578.1 hypothetical protein SODALDRAFT_374886 [Sodiomyces alkalinus F11]